tara:strand:+ start:167 stop:796 length:630 start_codon:yes stop_codon:yes gene_type:complete
MKITKRQLRNIIKEALLKEEAADCIKDYMRMGYSRSQAYKECDDGSDDYTSYSSYSRPRYSNRRKTSFVGAAANSGQIEAVESALEAKPNNFLSSVLDQLKSGRGLSSKQKSIVKKILAKTNKEAADLFEAAGRGSAVNMHRCMDGTMVDPSSQICHDDVVNRIEDAVHHRDSHNCGTENRIYYNGLLKGLRQKRNRLAKSLAFSQEAE